MFFIYDVKKNEPLNRTNLNLLYFNFNDDLIFVCILLFLIFIYETTRLCNFSNFVYFKVFLSMKPLVISVLVGRDSVIYIQEPKCLIFLVILFVNRWIYRTHVL